MLILTLSKISTFSLIIEMSAPVSISNVYILLVFIFFNFINMPELRLILYTTAHEYLKGLTGFPNYFQ